MTLTSAIERLRGGDEEAFALIYDQLSRPVLNHLVCMLGQQELAEEVLHETFMTLIAKINFYRHDPGLRDSFRSWVFRLATNRAIDEIRKLKKVRFEDVQAQLGEQASAEADYEAMERDSRVQGMILRLPLLQRTVLNLRLNGDLDHQEIARVCSCSIDSVKQALFLARRGLKTMLLEEGVGL